MIDQYAKWRQGVELGGGRELTRAQMESLCLTTDPESGFWRRRAHKDGPYVPVAIWRDDQGKVWCVEAGSASDADLVWTFCCRWPISEQQYHAVLGGQPWPDEPPSPPKDHNQVRTGDAAVDLEAEFAAEAELARDFLKKPVDSQEQADRLAVWSKKVAGILNKANNEFKVEKQPWLDGGKIVDDRWRWRQDADALVKNLKRALDGWLRELDRREQERQRKAREEADKIRREAEAKAAEAARAQEQQSKGIASLFAEETQREADRLAKQAAAADREAEARNVAAGRTGAKVSLRAFYEAEITDYDALVMALKHESEVREAVVKIANRIAKTQGASMPAGARRVEDKRAA